MNARLATPPELAPGRSCPLHYRYSPEVFAAPATITGLDVLYVVGGLYGNELALERVLELFAAESGRARLVFNGDFHWFDADPHVFARVQDAVLLHTAVRGNVETELAADIGTGDDAGCGCAYPAWVEDVVVERSNRILHELRTATTPRQRAQLAALPMWLRADIGDLKLAIVHGDAQSLSGWGFDQQQLRDRAHRQEVRGWFHRAGVDAFACTHTCLPVFQRLRGIDPGHHHWIFNNGAAGMPNFAGDCAGLVTRLAFRPFRGPQRRFGVQHGALFIDAIAIETPPGAAQARFLQSWPPGSDAHASYFDRMARGPAYQVHDAIRTGE
jgi:hypothetical protein